MGPGTEPENPNSPAEDEGGGRGWSRAGRSAAPHQPLPARPPPGRERPITASALPPPVPLAASPGAAQLTSVAPHSKEREHGRPVVGHAAQGQGRAVFEGERGTAGRGSTVPGPGRGSTVPGLLPSPCAPQPAAPKPRPRSEPFLLTRPHAAQCTLTGAPQAGAPEPHPAGSIIASPLRQMGDMDTRGSLGRGWDSRRVLITCSQASLARPGTLQPPSGISLFCG